MQQIAELERRITAALERIGQGVATLTAAPAPELSELPVAMAEAELGRLTEALDEERMANAQLNERLRVIRDKEADEKSALLSEIDNLTAQLAAQSAELDAIRAARTAEADELADIVAALNPLIAEARHDA